jgi:hypothetical protein
MQINWPTGPIAHAGFSYIVAYIFRLNPVVTVFCGLLPDLVDKPLLMIGTGGGRFFGHSLLFGIINTSLFLVWRRRYAPAALAGFATHLLLDLNALIPWFYPFKSYAVYSRDLDFSAWVKDYLSFSQAGFELVLVVFVFVVVYIGFYLYHRYAHKS